MNYHISGMSNTKSPAVSIIIPCYNMGPYVGDAVKSAVAQTFTDYEILIVDDGSTDSHTLSQLEYLGNEYPQLQIFHKKNSGLAETRNYGIERAKGEFIVSLDADDVLEPTYLEETVRVIKTNKSKKIGFVTTWVQEFGVRKNLWKTGDFNIPKLLMENQVHAGSLFRRDMWEKLGGFKKVAIGGYEDWEFWLNAVEHGYEWGIVEKPLFRYRIRANSMLVAAKNSHVDIYKINFDLHPKIYEKYSKELILNYAQEQKELRNSISAKDKVIEDSKQAIDYFKKQSEAHELRYESLLKSRITQGALGLINISVFFRRTVPNIIPRIRGWFRRLMPDSARVIARKIYRAIFPREVIILNNEKWTGDGPLVTIVTPFYNSAASIHETVDSVLNQTFQAFKYIIVDDGSKQEEFDVLKNISDKRVQVIRHKENIGKGSPARVRNIGIEQANSKYIICIDADDTIEPTFIEKCLVNLEADQSISLISTDMQMFGALDTTVRHVPYQPVELFRNNMIISAAFYRHKAWKDAGGYKPDIGYEDWDLWISMAEKEHFGKRLPEVLFNYRTAEQSRYIEDKKKHDLNIQKIKKLHPEYIQTVKQFVKKRKHIEFKSDPEVAFSNLRDKKLYKKYANKPEILVAIPWMTFGGAETLITNFCREVKDSVNFSFITGLPSKHEWEYKFKELTPSIYHLHTLFGENKELYLEFISNYIETREVKVLHIIHTSFMHDLLPELRKRHPELKIVITLFNDRAHFVESLQQQNYISAFTTDNKKVAKHLEDELEQHIPIAVIPNGIDCYDMYNPDLYNREEERSKLGLFEDEIAVFFIGRLSEEKNPDVFLDVAEKVNQGKDCKVKFFVIGDGPMGPEVESTVKQLDNDNIVYLGYQSEIAKYLSAADIFILPSSIEGFPLSILEAMAMKVAVVASDVGAVSQIVDHGKNGLVVEPGSRGEISTAVRKIAADPKFLASLKSKARDSIEEKYSNTILGNNYKTLYKEQLK